MTIIVFIIVLAALVFVHELGHFLAAKSSGIRVDEFGLGFPPTLYKFKRGETTYSLNAIPFGGFVKIFGENPDEESMTGPEKERSFFNKPKYIQAWVLAAGVIFNIIFAWLLLSLGFMIGMPVPEGYSSSTIVQNAVLTITDVQPGSPAQKAELKAGDKVIKLQAGYAVAENLTAEKVQQFVGSRQNQIVTVTFQRGEETKTVDVIPKTGIVSDRAAIGVGLEQLGTLRLPIHKAVWEAMKMTWYLAKAITVGLAVFLYQTVTGNAHLSDVTGPIGIAGMVGDATRLGIVYLLSFTAFISINLAVINLIPFPALDGGRLLFVLIEKIKGTPISSKIANAFNAVGFALLLLLMLVVTFQDIIKLIR
ncbi:RIP metalloprotease RseP [Candidatus Parcubacteria bacterium]|nr:RIP metalloprotease RseP [Candidatus Parcubacteria bacterium]